MSRARLALLLMVLSLPGCLVVTCGSTEPIGGDRTEQPVRSGAEPRPEPDTSSGAGTW